MRIFFKMASGNKLAVFSTKPYDKEWFEIYNKENKLNISITYFEERLDVDTAHLANGFYAICAFVNDDVRQEVIHTLAKGGVKLIAMRCAGFDRVDVAYAAKINITVCRVPSYSPDAVAEYALGLTLALNRKIPNGWQKCKQGNFSLNGQLGFDMKGKTVGIVGTGIIGKITARIFKMGFQCNVIAHDVFQNEEVKALGIEYVPLNELLEKSHIISLHCPLMPSTKHMINDDTVKKMRDGVLIINTSRGALVDIKAAITGLKSKKIGGLALDVYEEEAEVFFEDKSNELMMDDHLSRVMAFPNVIMTGHQAYFTKEALEQISKTTLENVNNIYAGNKKAVATNIVG